MSLTAAQHAVRMTGIGASEIGTVAGLVPYAKPIDVWLVKRGLREPFEGNQATRMGTALEPAIADIYAAEYLGPGERVAQPSEAWPDAVDGTLRHPDHPWVLASPDRAVMVGDKVVRLVEIKTAGPRTAYLWGDAHDAVPNGYRAQVEWQMAVTGVPVVDLVVLLAGEEVRAYRIERDPELWEYLLRIGREFWRLVQEGIEPPVDGSESWKAYLAARFPKGSGVLRPATGDEAEMVEELTRLKRDAKELKARTDALENRIKAAVGDDDGITTDTLCATWKADSVGHVAWKAVADELGAEKRPDIIAKHVGTPPRKLSIHPVKKRK